MSNFMLFSADASLWELVTKARWGSHDIHPIVKSFQVWVIMQAQLNTLSLAWVHGSDVGKPKQDMAFLLIAPNLTIGCKRVFGLTAVSAHSLPSPLPDSRRRQPTNLCYWQDKVHGLAICLHMAKQCTVSYVHPYQMKGTWVLWEMVCPVWMPVAGFHQLQICKLLQHKDRVVCPEGLNGKLEALQFTFPELHLWDAATPSEPFQELQLLEMDLSSVQPESMATAI